MQGKQVQKNNHFVLISGPGLQLTAEDSKMAHAFFRLPTEYVTDSYVCLGERGQVHGSCEKRLSLPWKTELFKNILPVSPNEFKISRFYLSVTQCSNLTVVHSSKTSKMYHWTSENYDYSYLWTSRQFLVFICFVFYEF